MQDQKVFNKKFSFYFFFNFLIFSQFFLIILEAVHLGEYEFSKINYFMNTKYFY